MANSWCFILSDSLAVVVEDFSSSCCVTVKVFPHMTTAALKQQVSLENASPLRLSLMQSRWVSFINLTQNHISQNLICLFVLWFSTTLDVS